MLHRASSAQNLMYNPVAQTRRSSSPHIGYAASAAGGASLMPHRKPDFTEGSVIEERDNRSQRVLSRYRVGPLLGQGGFAKCYDVKDLESGEHFALKVCERQKLIQTKTLNKLQTEIAIHRRMNHKYIVRFFKTFQDEWNVYILLELCQGTTLMDLSKKRKKFTVPETQFIMLETLMACDYMHTHNVIHRDLKLGNIMMDAEMNVKIGDFGLAAELLYDGERKRTICGTPNYIAPEILQNGRDGHSFEVDVWSVGVIMYTLLVGEPPFQTNDVKATYSRIKQCRYGFPAGCDLPEPAKQLIHRILQSNPNNRPTLMDIRNDPFFTGVGTSKGSPLLAPVSLFPSHLRAQKETQRERIAQAQQQQQQQPTSSSSSSNFQQQQQQQQPRTASACSSSSAATSCASSGNQNVCGGDNNNMKNQQQQPPLSGREALRPLFNGVTNNNNNNWPQTQQQPQPQSARPVTSSSSSSSSLEQPLSRKLSSIPMPNSQQQQDNVVPSARTSSEQQQQQVNNNNKPSSSSSNNKLDDDERDHFGAVHDELHRTLIQDAQPTTSATNAFSSKSKEPNQVYPGCTAPTTWVTDYADFSSRYGLAYRLSTGHTGVHYNDNTKLVWEPISSRAEYYTRVKETVGSQTVVSDQRSSFLMESSPESLNKKTTLIKYFRSYIKAGGKKDSAEVIRCSSVPQSSIQQRPLTESNMTSEMVYIKRWMLTSQAMVFRLSNRVIQVCFFDKSEVILASESKIVTFTDPQGNRKTMPLTAVNAEGGELAQKLMFTKDILSRLIANRDI